MSEVISAIPRLKLALGIEYSGQDYYGWQRQQSVISIQEILEKALSNIANETIHVQCAGRTDAGVHATGQVIHFETSKQRDLNAWTMGVNAHLPKDIAVQWAKPVAAKFHARFSATARRYRYFILNAPKRTAINSAGISHYYQPLDAERMNEAAQYLLGEQDFSAFRAAHCQSHSPFRHISHIMVNRYGRCIVVDIKANAFLHHMVRNIVGSLLEVGYGNQPIDWLLHLLKGKDRKLAAATAKSEGLYLVAVDYPIEYQLPVSPLGPFFMEMLP